MKSELIKQVFILLFLMMILILVEFYVSFKGLVFSGWNTLIIPAPIIKRSIMTMLLISLMWRGKLFFSGTAGTRT